MKIEELRDIDRVYVFKGDSRAGTITRTKDGSVFEYDIEYLERTAKSRLEPVAFTLPVESGSYQTVGDNLHPFFAGLLPEGRRLSALVSLLKTSADDMFSLLAASGADCIGDVFISLEPKLPSLVTGNTVVELSDASFFELFEQSLGRANLFARAFDFSAPGVQPKISAGVISFPLSIKKRTHEYILKLAPIEFPRLVENEHFFMEMAAACGLECATTAIVHDRHGTPGLLIERFDRRWDKVSNKFRRVHQEDACQILARYPQDKYRLSMRDIADGFDRYATSPIIESAKLIELTAFSYIICNGDLHAKNISLTVEPESGRTILAPAYDLVSTLPYGDQNMALMLEGRRSKLRSQDFIALGGRAGVKEAAIVSTLKRLAKRAAPFLERLDEIGLDTRITDFLRSTMRQRVNELLAN